MFSGINVSEMLRPFLDEQFGPGGWTMVGATSASSRDQSDVPPPCELSIVSTGDSGYEIAALSMPAGRRATPRSANGWGIIVGDGTPEWRGPSFPCVWLDCDSEIAFLPHFGGIGGSAFDINDAGTIVGGAEVPDRAMHACRWLPEEDILDIGAAVARNSSAKAINSSGQTVGWVSIHATEAGQSHFRPAYWEDDSPVRVFSDLGGHWGEGVDINDAGDMVMLVNDGKDTAAWVWRSGQTVQLGLPPFCKSFWPRAIDSSGAVVGLTIGHRRERGAAMWGPDGVWRSLELPGLAELTAAGEGSMAGYVEEAGYRVPWVVAPDTSAARRLPYIRYHHHHPNMITARGWVVGTASADNCSHPLVWKPTSS